jgi:hypothetical protein
MIGNGLSISGVPHFNPIYTEQDVFTLSGLLQNFELK